MLLGDPCGAIASQHALAVLGANSCARLLGVRTRFAGSISCRDDQINSPTLRLSYLFGDPCGAIASQHALAVLGANSCARLAGIRTRFAGSISCRDDQINSPTLRLSYLFGDPCGVVAFATCTHRARSKLLRAARWHPHPLRGFHLL